MKKHLSFTLVCILLLSFAFPAFADVYTWPDSDFQKTKLAFDAADYVTDTVCVKEKMYRADDKKRYTTTAYSYDRDGHLTGVKIMDAVSVEDGVEKSACLYTGKTFKYNSAGNLISKKNYTYAYNAKGLLSKMTEKDDGMTYTTSYVYDSKGRLLQSAHKYGKKAAGTDRFSYNQKGLLTKADYNTMIDFDVCETIATPSYDAGMNITKVGIKTIESTSDVYKETWKNQYDANGNLKADAVYRYVYDAQGRLVMAKDRENYEKTIYTYDKNDQLTRKVVYYNYGDGWSKGWITDFTYKKLPHPISKINLGATLKADWGIIFADKRQTINLNKWTYTYTGKAIRPQLTIDSLQPGADYYLQYADNVKPGMGKIVVRYTNGSPANIVYFQIVPQKPVNVKAKAVDQTSAALSWGKVTGASKYTVYQCNSDGTYTALTTVAANSATVKNLKPGTTYRFCVRALHGSLKSAYSAKVSVKTAK